MRLQRSRSELHERGHARIMLGLSRHYEQRFVSRVFALNHSSLIALPATEMDVLLSRCIVLLLGYFASQIVTDASEVFVSTPHQRRFCGGGDRRPFAVNRS